MRDEHRVCCVNCRIRRRNCWFCVGPYHRKDVMWMAIKVPDDHKIYYAGKARQEELDEIDSCDMCRIMPELEKTCYATAYCHRQMKMDLTD